MVFLFSPQAVDFFHLNSPRDAIRASCLLWHMCRRQTHNVRGSKVTYRWCIVSFSGTISLVNLRTAVIPHTWCFSQLKYAQMSAKSAFLPGCTSINITEAVCACGVKLSSPSKCLREETQKRFNNPRFFFFLMNQPHLQD